MEIISPLQEEDVVEDESELTRRLDFYYRHQESFPEDSKNRKEYVKRFSIEQMADNFKKAYEDLLLK